MARLELAGGGFERAERLLEKLMPANAGDFDVLFLLGRAAARAGHVARAREVLESALRLRPEDTGVMVEAGLANATSGDYPRAVFLLARARAQSPAQPRTWSEVWWTVALFTCRRPVERQCLPICAPSICVS